MHFYDVFGRCNDAERIILERAEVRGHPITGPWEVATKVWNHGCGGKGKKKGGLNKTIWDVRETEKKDGEGFYMVSREKVVKKPKGKKLGGGGIKAKRIKCTLNKAY